MEVDFNNIRKRTAYAFNKLTKKLNESIDEYGEVVIDAREIQTTMDDLRGLIGTICYVYKEGDDDFRDLTDEIDIVCFNDNEENNLY